MTDGETMTEGGSVTEGAALRDRGLPDLGGQRVLVTGATGVLGRGIVRCFAAAGAAVAVHHRSPAAASAAAAEALVAELRAGGATAVAVAADLDEPAAPEALIAATVAALGGVDGIVNNAGVQPVSPLDALLPAEWDAVIRTNLGAVFALSQAAAAAMERGGWITHIASVEAHRPAPGHAHYAVAKAGLLMHARAAALELGPRGIRVNTVSPGLIDRPGLAEDWPSGVESWLAHAPLGRLGTPEDIGSACVLLASPAASFITGQDLAVDGGMLTTPGW